MVCCGVLWCAVVCCGVLWCAVVCCGVLWCAVVCCGVLWCAVVWCGVLWCAVVCCGVLWCAVVCCGVLWCAVVCCGVLWCAWSGVCVAAWCFIVFNFQNCFSCNSESAIVVTVFELFESILEFSKCLRVCINEVLKLTLFLGFCFKLFMEM